MTIKGKTLKFDIKEVCSTEPFIQDKKDVYFVSELFFKFYHIYIYIYIYISIGEL